MGTEIRPSQGLWVNRPRMLVVKGSPGGGARDWDYDRLVPAAAWGYSHGTGGPKRPQHGMRPRATECRSCQTPSS